METITHRYSGRIYQAKVTKCHHHLLRHVSIDIQVKPTRWRRVSAATVQQLKNESVEFGKSRFFGLPYVKTFTVNDSGEIEIMKHKQIQSTQRLCEPRKESNVTFYSLWALLAACLAIALYFGIKWRLGV